ncbi:hypothetical protein KQ51_00974 [Candidatus Izimaplasma bacterium HR1]|jgi:hypothetical protein|uniref:hypothetical protein n=1 Tax=Candidatus Izimoplasma sp. HR1 TaxID=1541959 RepID=UPI0004F69B91|nr:hypothetical protein KQ51_00974 [Candidatus Izimaplasma bacterium HR1]
MKLLEKFIYSGIVFLVIYVIISVGLRVFEITSIYNSHMIGGIIATVLGVIVFMYLIVKK